MEIHPDSEHARIHDIVSTLAKEGFVLKSGLGTTNWGGEYVRGALELHVSPRSGLGDISGELNGQMIIAECKGGIINTKNSGLTSRLRRGLCEAVGQLMSREVKNERHIAVVPNTAVANLLASRMIGRTRLAGIEIALVEPDGSVRFQ